MLDTNQQGFIDLIVNDTDTRYFYLRGGAGSGKTRTILELATKKKLLLSAMSTKAATELGATAVTLHKALGVRIDDQGTSNANIDGRPPVQYRIPDLEGYILIVDEYSMLGEEMIDFVLDCNADKVVFVGDPNQIPPINSKIPEFPEGITVTLTNNHRASNVDMSDFITQLNNCDEEYRDVAENVLDSIPASDIVSRIESNGSTYLAYKNSSILAVSEKLVANGNTEHMYFKETRISGYLHSVNNRPVYKQAGAKLFSIIFAEKNVDYIAKPSNRAKFSSYGGEMTFTNVAELVEWVGEHGERIKLTTQLEAEIIKTMNHGRSLKLTHITEAREDRAFSEALSIELGNIIDNGRLLFKQQEGIFMGRKNYDTCIYIVNAFDAISSTDHKEFIKPIEYFSDREEEEGFIRLMINGKGMDVKVYTNPKYGVYELELKRRKQLRAYFIRNLLTILDKPTMAKLPIRKHGQYLQFLLKELIESINVGALSRAQYNKKYTVPAKMMKTFNQHVMLLQQALNASNSIFQLVTQLENVPCALDSRVRTVDASQGASLDSVIIDMNGLSKNRLYTGLSRAREELVYVAHI